MVFGEKYRVDITIAFMCCPASERHSWAFDDLTLPINDHMCIMIISSSGICSCMYNIRSYVHHGHWSGPCGQAVLSYDMAIHLRSKAMSCDCMYGVATCYVQLIPNNKKTNVEFSLTCETQLHLGLPSDLIHTWKHDSLYASNPTSRLPLVATSTTKPCWNDPVIIRAILGRSLT